MQNRLILLLALLSLIVTACSKDRGSPRPQQPTATAEADTTNNEEMPGEEMVSNKPVEMDNWSHQEIMAVVWSPDSAKLVVVDGDGTWLYDLVGNEVTRQELDGDAGKATSVAFSSSGEQLAVGLADGLIQLRRADRGELVAQFAGHNSPVKSLAFNPNGTMLASGAGQWYAEFVPRAEGVETRLWDVATGELRGILADNKLEPPVSHLGFSPDGTILAVGQQGHGCASPRCADGRLRLWQPAGNELAEMGIGHDIAFSGNGRFVAALGQIYESGQVQIWEVGTGNKLPPATTAPDGFAFDLALSQDGSTAAVVMGEYGYGGRTAYVWDVGTGAELAMIPSGAPIALSSDGRFLISSPVPDPANSQMAVEANGGLRLWDVRQRSEPVHLDKVEGSIGHLAFSPDDKWLAVTEMDVTGNQLHLIAIAQLLNASNVITGTTTTATPVPTLTPTLTAPGIAPTATAAPTRETVQATATPTPSPSPHPWTATPIPTESVAECPADWFMTNPPAVCPEGPALSSYAARQRFERGRMIWVEETDTFYILFNVGAHPSDSRLVFRTLGPLVLKPEASVDNRVEEDPPVGLLEPVSGFGLLWRGEVEGLDTDLRQALGWAVEKEFGFQTRIQCQRLETYSARTCFLLDADGSVKVLAAHAIAGNVWWTWLGTLRK